MSHFKLPFLPVKLYSPVASAFPSGLLDTTLTVKLTVFTPARPAWYSIASHRSRVVRDSASILMPCVSLVGRLVGLAS